MDIKYAVGAGLATCVWVLAMAFVPYDRAHHLSAVVLWLVYGGAIISFTEDVWLPARGGVYTQAGTHCQCRKYHGT